MNLTELKTKWQNEIADWNKAKNDESLKDKTRCMAQNRGVQLLHCLTELEQLNSLPTDETNAKLAASAPVLQQIVEAQGEYIKLLCDELDEVVVQAHGWKSTRFEQGKQFRDEITKLKQQL